MIKYFSTVIHGYGGWENIKTGHLKCEVTMEEINTKQKEQIHLKHGGNLIFFKKIISELRCKALLNEVIRSKLLRQYNAGTLKYPEPRLHVLLVKDSILEGGYQYHGTKMKPFSIKSLPKVNNLMNHISQLFNVEWNIGVHVIMYHNGQDSMGWHADDTQGERIVLSVVLESGVGGRKKYVTL